MKVVLTEFLTLDGVSQGPGSPDEDTTDGFTQGGWMVPFIDEAFLEQAADWLSQASALLLGRRTYDNFARDWPNITDPNDRFSATMNSLPKYVASHTLTNADWTSTTILSGDIATQVAELKCQPGRELQIHGSARLAHSLLTAELIDEVRLVVAPVVLGHGRRLFTGGVAAGLQPLSAKLTPGGLAIHRYTVAGAPKYATYQPGQ